MTTYSLIMLSRGFVFGGLWSDRVNCSCCGHESCEWVAGYVVVVVGVVVGSERDVSAYSDPSGSEVVVEAEQFESPLTVAESFYYIIRLWGFSGACKMGGLFSHNYVVVDI